MARGNDKVKYKVRSNKGKKRKGKNKDKNNGKGKGRQMKISNWVGRSSSPELCPNPDDFEERNARENLR
jgi:hypothetical protein